MTFPVMHAILCIFNVRARVCQFVVLMVLAGFLKINHHVLSRYVNFLWCFDTVGWATGRPSRLKKSHTGNPKRFFFEMLFEI